MSDRASTSNRVVGLFMMARTNSVTVARDRSRNDKLDRYRLAICIH